ncbi:MAG: transposase [Actinomycetes bacterium]
MVLIGVDPHKGSHTAVVVDADERELSRVTVTADRRQLEALLAFTAPFVDRRWAIESAGGLGSLVAQLLIGVGSSMTRCGVDGAFGFHDDV